jgi:2-isopropylmalate synthase
MDSNRNKAEQRRERDRVVIFDTTLRDGEQCPGATMTFEEKLEVAEVLDEMGVDIIEAGFPIASQGDFDSVQEISRRAKNSVICGLARAQMKDIDLCADAIKPAKRGRIHTFIGTSPLHRKYQMGIDESEVLACVTQSVTRARSYTDDVEWSAMDATRTEHDFLCRCVEAAIRAGATTVNIPDTVGYATPDEFAALIRMIIERVPGADAIVFSTHCHNDLGLAVANSLAGVGGGARQVECAVNGLGERAGNAALEEIAAALHVRSERYGVTTDIKLDQLYPASQVLGQIITFRPSPNKAIVGANAFAHESGIHQHGMLANPLCYEIMTPTLVGVSRTNLVLGKHSGRAALRHRLEQLGYTLSREELQQTYYRFAALADRKKNIYDQDLIGILPDPIRDRRSEPAVAELD